MIACGSCKYFCPGSNECHLDPPKLAGHNDGIDANGNIVRRNYWARPIVEVDDKACSHYRSYFDEEEEAQS